MIDPAVAALLAVSCALLFLSAAVHKLRDLASFGALFEAYRLLPPSARPLSILIPLGELLIAAGLLWPATRAAAALAGAALLLLYAMAMGINLARGRRELSCGCGGFAARRPIARWMVMRNLLLAVLLSASAAGSTGRPLQTLDGLTVVAGSLIAVLLYSTLDRLLAEVLPRSAVSRGEA